MGRIANLSRRECGPWIIDASIAALPLAHRRRLLFTIEGAGSTHDVVEHLTALNSPRGYSVQYSVGFDLDSLLPEHVCSPALEPAGKARDDGAGLAEVTGLLRHSHGGDHLSAWPAELRVFVRREPIEHGTQLSLFEQTNGYRYQPFATNTDTGSVQHLQARHRVYPAPKASSARPRTPAWPGGRRHRSR